MKAQRRQPHHPSPAALEPQALMRLALRLAARATGRTSPNPMVGAVLVKDGVIIGQGWHHQAGGPHAEIEAINDAHIQGRNPSGATLYVTLEPCCTQGRTPPCTQAILSADIRQVVVAAADPNPAHCGRGFALLREQGVAVEAGLLASHAAQLNEAFNHWIVNRTPFVTVKAAMSLDGKTATVAGQSKWITGERSRALGMKLRLANDAILAGVKTIIQDNPSLTWRGPKSAPPKPLRRIILDPTARVPLDANVITDVAASLTTVVVTDAAPAQRVAELRQRVRVLIAPQHDGGIDLPWLLRLLGSENVTALLVEGGGETAARFLLPRLAQRIAFFYAPILIGGRTAPTGVAGLGIQSLADKLAVRNLVLRHLGPDLFLTGLIQ